MTAESQFAALFEMLQRHISEVGSRAVESGEGFDFALIMRLDDGAGGMPFWRVVRSMPDQDDLLTFLGEAQSSVATWDLDPTRHRLPAEPLE